MRRPRSPAACAAALAAVLMCAFAAAPAHAQIVPQRGIKGIRLGMSATEVRARLGVPDRNTTRPDEIQGRIRIYAYGLTTATFATAGRARVIAVSTSSRRERTSRGIGVGSTRASVRENVPGARCRREFGIDH
jgi:hypothetical protein